MSALVLESGTLGRKLSDFGQVSLGWGGGEALSFAGKGVCPPPAVERSEQCWCFKLPSTHQDTESSFEEDGNV